VLLLILTLAIFMVAVFVRVIETTIRHQPRVILYRSNLPECNNLEFSVDMLFPSTTVSLPAERSFPIDWQLKGIEEDHSILARSSIQSTTYQVTLSNVTSAGQTRLAIYRYYSPE